MAMSKSPYFFQIGDESGVGEARRSAVALAETAGFTETETGKVAIAITEAATNVLKHAGGGEILLRTTPAGIEMLAIDKGPGITDLNGAMRDGESSAGTAGIGLGASHRLASHFDIYSLAGVGTALAAEFHPAHFRPPARLRPTLEIGVAQAPYPGEAVSGDAWSTAGTSVLVVDGLGHGFHASQAAQAALAAFADKQHRTAREVIEAIHHALAPTRGAAVAVADIDPERHVLRFCGLGNISGAVVVGPGRRGLMSYNGTAGHEMSRIVQLDYAWPDGAMLVMHTDGISAKWDLDAYPGLASRRPALIAAVLYRDFRRRNDDATVVVARVCPPDMLGGSS
jgi:anti-sigma regulatory factor (Ser/Thr protein kinase)